MQNSDKLDLIIDILKRHEKQFDQIDKRFDLIDQRFEQVDKKFEQIEKRLDHSEEENRDKFNQISKRFDQLDKRFDRNEADMRWMRDKILELWESRKEVAVKFSRNWAWQNMIYSGGISITVFIIGFFMFVK